MKLFVCLLSVLLTVVAARHHHRGRNGRTYIRVEHTKAQAHTPVAAEIMTTTPIPESFDSRQAWPNCASIGQIRNQGQCGDCWAVAAAGAITDRICIASNQTQNPIISGLDILSCGASGDGCQGDYVDQGWVYWNKSGVVTGGEAGTTGTCEPYNLPWSGATPSCSKTCATGYATSYANDKHYGKSHYIVQPNVPAIQKEIMTNGPVETGFTIYTDFDFYSGGIYFPGYNGPANETIYGHAVKIIGWDTDCETSTDYWIMANQWGTDWGENGFFRMRRGQNDCGIESDVAAGLPKL